MDLRILEEIGLSEAEAKIYLALIRLGQSKTGRIIDVTKLQSSTVYHVLGSLIEKGIVTYIHKGKIKFYQAESPNILLSFLNEKKKKISNIIPELNEMEKLSRTKQNAKIYEGIKGIQAAFNDILEVMKKGEEYYFFQFPYEKLQNEQVLLFLRNFHLKRVEKGIKVKGIASPKCKHLMKEIYKLSDTDLRYLDSPAPTVVVIYKNKILQLDWGEVPTAFTIQSKTIYNSHKQFFLEKWSKATH
ncbi:hypothetical protein GOV09_04110 [Candidatus Woesearchaeota archaeon]|nr:hypothetical protein [Candidatus Woesearchaeota archaeon]